ncbi:hypothetical protein EDB87DRAFT_1664548 [Lactarius vividus]|nr:hypothetical protein EDB87DRAFT_1664548 [Lactarius vividus]
MLPCSSIDILASLTSNQKHVIQRWSYSGFEGQTSLLTLPSTPGLSGTALVEDRHSVVGATSWHLSGVSVQSPMFSGSSLGPSHVGGQQGVTHSGRNQSRSRVDTGIMLARSVPSLDPNKHFFVALDLHLIHPWQGRMSDPTLQGCRGLRGSGKPLLREMTI